MLRLNECSKSVSPSPIIIKNRVSTEAFVRRVIPVALNFDARPVTRNHETIDLLKGKKDKLGHFEVIFRLSQ